MGQTIMVSDIPNADRMNYGCLHCISMERFVQFVVMGGAVMLAGIWFTRFTEAWTSSWMLGAAAAVLGGGGILWGVWSQVDAKPMERWV